MTTKLCIECGHVLPQDYEGAVCETCLLTKNISFIEFTCPECGEKLEIWAKQLLDYVEPQASDEWPRIAVGLLYHCDKCGRDWSSEYVNEWGDSFQSELQRHYWG